MIRAYIRIKFRHVSFSFSSNFVIAVTISHTFILNSMLFPFHWMIRAVRLKFINLRSCLILEFNLLVNHVSPARSEQVKLCEGMGSGSKDCREASREPDDLNVHCAEYLQNRKCNFGSVDHTGWVVVPTINILQAIAPTATRRQSLFWTVRHRPVAFGQPIRGQHWPIEE